MQNPIIKFISKDQHASGTSFQKINMPSELHFKVSTCPRNSISRDKHAL
jgi:hypothetical protein